jgi:hypothetical protein
MSATDAKVNEVIAESLGVSALQLFTKLHARLLAAEDERTGRLQGLTLYRNGSARAVYVYGNREFRSLAELAAYGEGR